jgi:hypothetical protein
MPEFRMTELQVAEEEFIPSHKKAVEKRKEPEEATQGPRDASPGDSPAGEPRRALLKRGRLPRTKAIENDKEDRVIGEIREQGSVFHDALSQKLSTQKRSSAGRESSSPKRPVSIEKTTRILDENRQEIEESSFSPERHNAPTDHVKSSSHTKREPHGRYSRAQKVSGLEGRERQDKGSCGHSGVAQNFHEGSRPTLKEIWRKWWRKFTNCFRDFTGVGCEGHKQHPKKSRINSVSGAAHVKEKVNEEDKIKSGNRSPKMRHSRRDSVRK